MGKRVAGARSRAEPIRPPRKLPMFSGSVSNKWGGSVDQADEGTQYKERYVDVLEKHTKGGGSA